MKRSLSLFLAIAFLLAYAFPVFAEDDAESTNNAESIMESSELIESSNPSDDSTLTDEPLQKTEDDLEESENDPAAESEEVSYDEPANESEETEELSGSEEDDVDEESLETIENDKVNASGADLKYHYDPDLAISKAKTLLDSAVSSKAKCAAYVSSVLRAGGLTNVKQSGAGDLIDYLNKASNFGGTIGSVIVNPTGDQLAKGDVLAVVCAKGGNATNYTNGHSKGTGKYYGLHVMIVSSVTSSTKVKYYAANNAKYNETLTLSTYKVTCSKCNNSSNAHLIAFHFNDAVKNHSLNHFLDINAANFPDPIFREWIINNLSVSGDTVGGYYLTEDQAKSIESLDIYLDVNSDKITSLKGIENFVNLTELRCTDNLLTELDVSKNTKLMDLNCSDNKISVLDVSKNSSLKFLYCNSNELTQINIKNNTALKGLYCSGNHLTSIDVSNNTELEAILCDCNQLTSLDLSNNPALIYIVCSNNLLTKLDLEKNIRLQELWCQGNKLGKLDLSKNSILSEFDIVCEDQTIEKQIGIKDDTGYKFDLTGIVPPSEMQRVSLLDSSNSIDRSTGIITFNSLVTEFKYTYLTGCGSKMLDVTVEITFNEPESLKYHYDADLAISKASELLDSAVSSGAKSATYVSSVLRAGGLTNVKKSGAGDLIDFLNLPSNFGDSIGEIIPNPMGSNLAKGDVLAVVCSKGGNTKDFSNGHSKGTGKYYGLHVMVISEIVSDTQVKVYTTGTSPQYSALITLSSYAGSIKCSSCGNATNSHLIAFHLNDAVRVKSTPLPATIPVSGLDVDSITPVINGTNATVEPIEKGDLNAKTAIFKQLDIDTFLAENNINSIQFVSGFGATGGVGATRAPQMKIEDNGGNTVFQATAVGAQLRIDKKMRGTEILGTYENTGDKASAIDFVDLRLQFQLTIPDGVSIADTSWSWKLQYGGKEKTVDGVKYLQVSGKENTYTTNVVVTNIPLNDYSEEAFRACLSVHYTKDGVEYSFTQFESTPLSRTIEALVNGYKTPSVYNQLNNATKAYIDALFDEIEQWTPVQ